MKVVLPTWWMTRTTTWHGSKSHFFFPFFSSPPFLSYAMVLPVILFLAFWPSHSHTEAAKSTLAKLNLTSLNALASEGNYHGHITVFTVGGMISIKRLPSLPYARLTPNIYRLQPLTLARALVRVCSLLSFLSLPSRRRQGPNPARKSTWGRGSPWARKARVKCSNG